MVLALVRHFEFDSHSNFYELDKFPLLTFSTVVVITFLSRFMKGPYDVVLLFTSSLWCFCYYCSAGSGRSCLLSFYLLLPQKLKKGADRAKLNWQDLF